MTVTVPSTFVRLKYKQRFIMDHVDGFIMLAIAVIMSVSFVFGTVCSMSWQRNDDKKKPPIVEGLFQIKDKDHAAVHLYSDCHRARGAEMIPLEHCNICKCVIRTSEFCSSCTTRREKLKRTQ